MPNTIDGADDDSHDNAGNKSKQRNYGLGIVCTKSKHRDSEASCRAKTERQQGKCNAQRPGSLKSNGIRPTKDNPSDPI